MTRLAATLLASTVAFSTLGVAASYADSHSAGSGHKSEMHGSHGKKGGHGPRAKMARMCNPERIAHREERMAAVDAFIDKYLNLTGDQIALYDAAKEAGEGAKAQRDAACQAVANGERPDRKAFRAAMKPTREAMQAFYQSLDDEQKATMDLIRPMRGMGMGKRGH